MGKKLNIRYWDVAREDGVPLKLPTSEDELRSLVDRSVRDALRLYISKGSLHLTYRKGGHPTITFMPDYLESDLDNRMLCQSDLKKILRYEVDGRINDPLTDLSKRLLDVIKA